jgi:hypothetical protein
MRGTLLATAVAALALATAGCSQDPNKATVKGRVTLDGVAVEKGAVQFSPLDGKTSTGKPGMIENGEYAAEIPVGTMRVVINAPKKSGKKRKLYDTPDSPVVEDTVEAIPAKYNKDSILKKDIQPGEQTINFDLTTK